MSYIKTGLCPECNAKIYRLESSNGVQDSFEYNDDTKEWEHVDCSYDGETYISYNCDECGWYESVN